MPFDAAAQARIAFLAELYNRSPNEIADLGFQLISRCEPGFVLWLLRIVTMPEDRQSAIVERLLSPTNRRAAELGVAA